MSLVKFEGGMVTAASPVYTEDLESYRDDARRVIRIVMGAGTQDDLDDLSTAGLNAMGVCNLFAALALEVDDGYQGQVAGSLRDAS
jgi:hypothetical protein